MGIKFSDFDNYQPAANSSGATTATVTVTVSRFWFFKKRLELVEVCRPAFSSYWRFTKPQQILEHLGGRLQLDWSVMGAPRIFTPDDEVENLEREYLRKQYLDNRLAIME